ncbi:MAG TPA: SgcJ/EcaC family oxidoreductase [Bacillales bacterium]|nr:SgcJ/EcaC family oxidoreductase [Bacillales bacterium]
MAEDEQYLRNLFQAMSTAWNNGDGEAFGTCFTEDCDYVTFNGQHLEGRKAVAEVHQQLFDGVLRGSTMNHDIKDIRFLNSDTAIVHVVGAVKLRWQKSTPKGRDSINTNVAVKRNGVWKITAFHNCRIKGPNWIQKILMKTSGAGKKK